MSMRPRKFIFKKMFKRRSSLSPKNNHLNYGEMGLQILQPLRLHAKRMFRLKLFLKRSSRKVDTTRRQMWFNLFPHLPLTKKVKGSRMGKGSGKPKLWVTCLPSGLVVFEFRNLRYGRFLYFSKQVTHKLPVPTKPLILLKRRLHFPGKVDRSFIASATW